MELTISHPFFRIPHIIPPQCKASAHDNRFISIKLKAKNIKSSYFPFECSKNKLVYGKSRSTRFLIYFQHKRNSIWPVINKSCKASAEIESVGSDPALVKAEDESPSPDQVLAQVFRFGSTCLDFVRPIPMFRTIVSTTSLFARVLVENPQLFKWSLLFKTFPGLIAVMLANAYSIGLNQIYDADIDRVNKPYLPIVTGDLSLKQAWFLVIFELLVGLLIFRFMNADLITTVIYCLGLILATFYSTPPFRFKESSVATSIVIPLMGGVIENIGILYATTVSLGLPFRWSPSILFITTFITLHVTVISFTKDLADVEGDMKHNIQTFAVKFGPRNIVLFGTGMLLANYIGAITTAICMPQAFKCHVMLSASLLFALWLIFQARKLDKANYTKEASTDYYISLWKLLMMEYLLFPFM